MTEDVFILDCHTCIFVWVGQQVDVKVRLQALDVGEVIIFISMQQLKKATSCLLSLSFSLAIAWRLHQKFVVLDFLMENLSRETPIFTVMEGSEPPFFTRFFTWDSAKSLVSRLGVCLTSAIVYSWIYVQFVVYTVREQHDQSLV